MGLKPLLKLSKVTSLIVAGGVLMANGAPAWAHHSYAMWNHNKSATVSGTIGAVQWMNPHVWVWVYVPKKDGGGYDLYGFQSNTVRNISRLGWHRDSLKIGDKVSIEFFPLMNSEQHVGYFIQAHRSDGSTVLGDTAAELMTQPSKEPELEIVPPKNIAPPK